MEIERLTAGKLVEYRKKLSSDIRRVYSVATDARKLGKDVTDRVEVPLASDMAARIEALLEVEGLADIMRSMPADLSREEVAIRASKEIAKLNPWKDRRKALDISVRVGLAILTEGILVAPLEGIRSVDIRGDPGREYVAVVYSGPIRSAGGTAQALSVLIADIVRRDLGIGEYNATEDEIERNMEEVQSYTCRSKARKAASSVPEPETSRPARVAEDRPSCNYILQELIVLLLGANGFARSGYSFKERPFVEVQL